MRIGRVTLAAAAIAAASAPIAGQAIAADRSAAPISGESAMAGSPYGILVVLVLVALAIGVASGGDDEPASP